MKVNVIAVDDHDIALAGIASVLQNTTECNLVSTFSTVDDACFYLMNDCRACVDLVLLDLRLSDCSDPYENVLRFRDLGVHILIFSSLEDPYLTRRAVNAGAAGILEKTASLPELHSAIQIVCAGNTYATADWASVIDSDPRIGSVDLSKQQLAVLELYASGESAKRVASLLDLSTETVQDYINRIRHKYALAGRPASTKVDMYRRAIEDGYLPGPLGV